MNFDQVWHTLEHGVPPEITHARNHQHPGRAWWLKTAVSSMHTEPPLLKLWLTLQAQHADLIMITPTAYDWQAELIAHTSSVWIAQDCDIRVEYHNPDFAYEIVHADHSSNQWGVHLAQALHAYAESKNPHELMDQHWHNLVGVSQFISTRRTHQQALFNRKGTHIVQHSSSDPSSPPHSPELDIE